MNNEDHRNLSISAYEDYERGVLTKLDSVRISDLSENGLIEQKSWDRIVYFLRLDTTRNLDPTVLAIPNRNDAKNILYIGGHSKLHGGTRYNELINASRKSQAAFKLLGYATNDQAHKHSVAGCLTTALLNTGFRIQDCLIDVVSGSPKYDELEFIIGYQERYHHLPPWNSNRKGCQVFAGND